MEGNRSFKHTGTECAHSLPPRRGGLGFFQTGGITSSADSDGGGLRLEPRHYCLIVLSGKYGPLCFMRGGVGWGRDAPPSPATRNHIQLNKRTGLLPVELWFGPPPPAASTAASTSAPPMYSLPLRSHTWKHSSVYIN